MPVLTLRSLLEHSRNLLHLPAPILPPTRLISSTQLNDYNKMQEDYFALKLLLFNLHKLRAEVARTWEGYKQGALDLIVASIIMDTAGLFKLLYITSIFLNLGRGGAKACGVDI